MRPVPASVPAAAPSPVRSRRKRRGCAAPSCQGAVTLSSRRPPRCHRRMAPLRCTTGAPPGGPFRDGQAHHRRLSLLRRPRRARAVARAGARGAPGRGASAGAPAVRIALVDHGGRTARRVWAARARGAAAGSRVGVGGGRWPRDRGRAVLPRALAARLRELAWVAEVAVPHETVVEHFSRARGAVVIPAKLFTMFSSLEK